MTQDIELALAKGKIVGARKLLQEYYEAQDKQEFEAKLRAEYDELYPSFTYIEDVVTDVKDTYIKDGYIVYNEFINEDGIQKYSLQKKIDYSEDENYKTFEEYKNETRVVSEAVEATYDEDGIELTPYIPEVTELVRPYVPLDNEVIEAKISSYEPYKALLIDNIKKSCKANDPIEINGITFNGGMSSASAISGAVELAQSLGESDVKIWDYNNIVHTFTLIEAFEIAKQIAVKYRNDMLDRQNQITELLNGI